MVCILYTLKIKKYSKESYAAGHENAFYFKQFQ